MSSDFYFQNFFPKNLAKKLGRVLQWRISGTARVRVRFCSTPPPFRADERYPGVLPEGRISRRGIRRARIIGLVDRRLLPVSCPRDGNHFRPTTLIFFANFEIISSCAY